MMSSSPHIGTCPNCGAVDSPARSAPGEPLKCPVCGWIYAAEGVEDITLARELPPEVRVPPPEGVQPVALGAPAPAQPPAEPAASPAAAQTFAVSPPASTPSAEVLPPTAAPAPRPLAVVTSGYSIASLVLGICSICLCFCYAVPSLVCGTLAVVFAKRGEKDVALGQRGPQSLGMSNAGRIMGFIGIGLGALYLVIIVIYIIVVIVAASGGFN
jgi:hypothetical protein